MASFPLPNSNSTLHSRRFPPLPKLHPRPSQAPTESMGSSQSSLPRHPAPAQPRSTRDRDMPRQCSPPLSPCPSPPPKVNKPNPPTKTPCTKTVELTPPPSSPRRRSPQRQIHHHGPRQEVEGHSRQRQRRVPVVLLRVRVADRARPRGGAGDCDQGGVAGQRD